MTNRNGPAAADTCSRFSIRHAEARFGLSLVGSSSALVIANDKYIPDRNQKCHLCVRHCGHCRGEAYERKGSARKPRPGYILKALAARFYLREQVTPVRSTRVVMVASGIVLILR